MKTFSNNLKRVKKLQNKLKNNQWALVCQKANLFYLGFANADFLLISATDIHYFCQQKSELDKLWNGEETANFKQGLPHYSKNILDFLKNLNFEMLYTDLTIESSPQITHLCQKINLLSSQFPAEKLSSLIPLIAPMRMIKDNDELRKMRKANLLTKQAIKHLKTFLKPKVKEYELKAELDYFLARQGFLKQAFIPIIASDDSSCILHKQGYDREMKKNILLDLGANYQNYCADISRSYFLEPTPLQERALQLVKNTQKYLIMQIKPGMLLTELNEICKESLSNGLKEMGIISQKSQLQNYFMHSVSHHLGVETHDLCLPNLPLQENMVITIEPGLYFWEKGFGIRIEDDLLITAKGTKLLADI